MNITLVSEVSEEKQISCVRKGHSLCNAGMYENRTIPTFTGLLWIGLGRKKGRILTVLTYDRAARTCVDALAHLAHPQEDFAKPLQKGSLKIRSATDSTRCA